MASQDAVGAAPAIVTLTTDFGVGDAYVGVMKGVILSRAPLTRIVGLGHGVTANSVLEAAFTFEAAWRFFPSRTVHVVVVDPGVGTPRRRLAIACEGHLFVGPDNGCLSGALLPAVRGLRAPGANYEARAVSLPAEIVAVSIENESLMLRPVSATFEGRDVFAPAAAHLAGDGPLLDLGPRIDSVLAFPQFKAPRSGAGLDGRVLRADRFGNLITDIRHEDAAETATFVVARRKVKVAMSYAAADGLGAIAGSSGYFEIAMRNGSAAAQLGVGAGEHVVVAVSG
jgi:S-adenosylmethionine hydrolase